MPRVEVTSIGGLKPSSSVTKTFREAADRLYDAYLLDPTPTKRFGIFDRAYAKFVRETQREFEKMAAKIHRMWSLPEAVEPQDCLQDLHVEIVRIFGKYDPEKATVAAFLVWNAFARAKKACNQQRGKVKGRDPSVHALPLSWFVQVGGEGRSESIDDAIDRLGYSDERPVLDVESFLDSKAIFADVFDYLSHENAQLLRACLENDGNVRAAVLARLSPDEMALDDEDRKHLINSRASKVMRTLRREFSVVLTKLECEGDERKQPDPEESPPKSERRPKRRNRTTESRDRRQPQERPIEETIRSGGSEPSLDDVAAAWAAARRKSRRENEATCVLLCA